jgi:hypothetical protein
MGFEVVGYDLEGAPIVEHVADGDVMGDYGPVDGDVMGAAAANARHLRGGRKMRIPPRPQWRNQLAPGVIQPDEGMVPLPMIALAGSPAGTFTSTVNQITFQGQLQKPFRGERLLVSVVRTGTDATGILLTQLFVGTDLQGAEISGWDAEVIGSPTAFGTRLTMKPAEPGVQIRFIVTLSGAMTVTTSSIFASFTVLGRIVH